MVEVTTEREPPLSYKLHKNGYLRGFVSRSRVLMVSRHWRADAHKGRPYIVLNDVIPCSYALAPLARGNEQTNKRTNEQTN
jgi:hypothetical protein